jgi:hypothetical protein
MSKIVGLSMSFCVRDIAEGRVDESEVVMVITGTRCKDYDALQSVIDIYKETYWSKSPKKSEEIAKRLWDRGLIHQPRLENDNHYPGLADQGIWIEMPEGIVV